jgi:hypothetical protein
MVEVHPRFCRFNILLALVQRWLALWAIDAKPPARFVRRMQRVEAALAATIRGSRTEDGKAIPQLGDPALLTWFARDRPGANTQHRAPFSRLRWRGRRAQPP